MAMFRTEILGAKRLLSDARNFVKITKVPDDMNAPTVVEYNRNSDSVIVRWMEEVKYDGSYIVQLHHDFDKTDPKNEQTLGVLATAVNGGIQLDIPELGLRVFEHIGSTAGGVRTCTTVFMEKGFGKDFIHWYCLGDELKVFKRLPREKVIVYLLQAFSSTRTWSNAFDSLTRQELPEPDMRKVVICNDSEFIRKMVEVAMVSSGNVDDIRNDVKSKDSDGLAIILHNSKTNLEAFTGRQRFFKGLIVPQERECVKKAFPGMKIKDMFGNEHDLDDVSMIWFTSSFKGYRAWCTAEEFEDYKAKCFKIDAGMLVCKQAHPHSVKRIPTQQMQAIKPTAAEERVLIWKASGDLHTCETVEGLISMIPNKYERCVAKMMPCYLGEQLVKEALQMFHLTRLKSILSGCLPDSIYYCFAAPDMYPIWCNIFGVEPKFILKAGQITLRHPKVPYGRKTVVMRNPCGTRGILIRENVQIPEELKGMYPGTVCYFSCQDLSMLVLQMDYDGDTVGVMTVKNIGFSRAYYDALRRAWKETDYHAVDFPTNSPKTKYSRQAAKEDTIMMRASEIGLVANAITRLIDLQSATWDTMTEAKRADMNEKLTVLEAALTLIIDSAKNGSNKDIAATVSRAREIINDAVKTIPAPMHTFWKKKVSINDIIENDYDLQKTIAAKMEYRKDGTPKFIRRNSWMGRYTAAVESGVLVKLPIDQFVAEGQIEKWCPEGIQKRSAQWRAFCKVPPKAAPELSFKGIGYDSNTHETNWNTTFIGRMFGSLIGLRTKYTNRKLLNETLKTVIPAARETIFGYANQTYGLDKDQTISTIIMYFYSRSHTTDKQHEKITLRDIKDCIWLLFGNEIVENVKANLGLPQDFELEDSGEEPVADDEIVYSDDSEYASFMTDEQYEEMYNNTSEEESGFYSDEGWFDND